MTLRDPVVVAPQPDPEELDPEQAYRLATNAGWDETTAATFAAWALGLPATFEATGPEPWSIREVRHLRFLAGEYEAGGFAGDRNEP